MHLAESFSELFAKFENWLALADQSKAVFAAIAVVVVIVVRRPLANLAVKALNALMKHLSVSLPEEALEEMRLTTSVLIVVLTIFLMLDVVDLPAAPNQFGRRVLASVAIIAVFSAWYNLCKPFVSLLNGDTRFDLKMETGWMERMAQFGVLLFGITALLTVWEIDISGALTGVGVLGAGLAIATQDLIRNLIAGMNNLSEKRFSVGDIVQIEGVLIGVVEQIDLRSTRLRGFDQIPRYVPNSDLSNAVVLNYSHRNNFRVQLRIGYVLSLSDAQIAKVCDALRDHLLHSGDFSGLENAPKHVYVEGLSDSAIKVLFYAWTNNSDYQEYLQVSERLTLKILEISRRFDAPLAYPTQTVRVAPVPEAGAEAP